MVQNLLGHASISSTKIYTHISQQKVGKIAKGLLNKLFRNEKILRNLSILYRIPMVADVIGYRGTGIITFFLNPLRIL